MAKRVIVTIGREFGSGGREIGKALADSLGVEFYDKELLEVAAKESGISRDLFESNDEKPVSSLLYSMSVNPYSMGNLMGVDHVPINQKLFLAQFDAIRKIVRERDCVIVGRCADFILRDLDNVLRIYVHAPIDYCIEKTIELHPDFDAEEARRFIQRTDKGRSDYYRCFTGNDWKNADNYDLCINSAVLGWDKCVSLVKSYLDIKLS